jgi:hypothetical protein
VPRGSYVHLAAGTQERFQCAPGPAGWRYVSDRSDGLHTDLTVDSRWCPVRMELRSRDWLVRGGLTGPELLWLRSPAGSGAPSLDSPGTTEHATRAAGFLGDSPAFLVAVARSLRLAEGAQAEVRLVRVGGPHLAALTVPQRWRLAEITRHDTDLGPLPVERYEITDLATSETTDVHLAGDVVLAAPGIELTDLDTPPTSPP